MIKNKLTTIINNNLNEINKNQTNLTKFFKPTFILCFCKKINFDGEKKNKIICCGNGGSASQSLHLTSELIGKFKKKRKGINSIDLSSNTASLTAIANDFGYANVFSRQLEAIGKKGDMLVCFSTSGKSKNIIETIKIAKKKENIFYINYKFKNQK